MTRLSLVLAGLLALPICQGCSVYLAASQPDKVNIPALEQGGLPRDAVIARLGAPTSSTRTPDGRRTDLYEFYKGSATGWKVGRATFHLVADVFSAALWEIIATPTELAIRGNKITARVDYDRNDMVTRFKVLGRKPSRG
ncbi:MAG: hypothetical protein ACYTGW_07800 [Planctomycetota bacterium]|jgi:hypothetical protein